MADGFSDLPITLPCGRCIGCRLEHSRQWAVRCMHEAQLHNHNSFITLTYAPEHLPADQSIHKEELQKFFKRLRKGTGLKLRYFACGEYGDQNNRPHYHAIIFGTDFPDRQPHKQTKQGDLLYTSETLQKYWTKGFSLIGEVTFESAAYVARYVMKKRKGDQDDIDEHYKLLDPNTGEIHQLEPEFCLMSRNPGLGKEWLKIYKSDTDKDFITVRGVKQKLPKYYDSMLAIEDELEMEERKITRRKAANKQKSEQTYDRLTVRENVKYAQIGQLTREIETL